MIAPLRSCLYYPVMTTTRFGAAISILRPHLAVLAVVCAGVGYAVSPSATLDAIRPTLLAVTVFGISAGTMPLNDIVDRRADSINRPERPIPSGLIRLNEAVVLFVAVSAMGLAAALPLGRSVFVVSLVIFAIATLYNLVGKGWGVLGNAMVSVAVAGTFIVGSLAAGSYGAKTTLLVALGFSASLTLETAGDILDAPGDRVQGVASFATTRGDRAAKALYRLYVVLFLLVCIVAPALMGEAYVRLLWVTIPTGVGFAVLSSMFLRSHGKDRSSARGTRIILIQAAFLTASVAALALV